MITFPKEFVATRYPGYFWNMSDNRLYSVKVTGTLKPLYFQKANQFNNFTSGYRVSVNGKRRFLHIDYLKNLTMKPSVFPIYTE